MPAENFPKHHPIKSMDDLKAYTWPDPDDKQILAPIRDLCDRYQKDYFIIVDMSSTLIGAAYAHIVGTQNFFLKMFDEPELVDALLGHVMDFYSASSTKIFALCQRLRPCASWPSGTSISTQCAGSREGVMRAFNIATTPSRRLVRSALRPTPAAGASGE